jgi:hypothetical protein
VSSPLASPSDLATYLGLTTIDENRAMLFLQLAQDKCESVVSPLPIAAMGVVLTVAARGFANPEGVTAETVGPYTVQRGTASLYLTKDDKATLRRLSGRSGAFSIDVLPKGVSAVQLVTISGLPTGGTFKLSISGQVSVPLAYNTTPAAVQAALETLPSIGKGNIAVIGNGPYTLTFINDLATTPIATLTADSTGLTGGTNPSVTVTVVTIGVMAPGQGLPYWDRSFPNQRGVSIIGQP